MEPYDPETDASAPDNETPTSFQIDTWQIKMITQFDITVPRRAYQHVYAFVKNKQAMTRSDFSETQTAIRDILGAKGVNCGILMFMHGTYVFTEVPVDLNPLMIKLASGINFNGEVTSTLENLFFVNSELGR